MTSKPRITVILTTYNWPDALRLALASLAEQSYRRFEVIVADDGSGPETRDVVDAFQQRHAFPLQHVWQEDRGFRAGAIRNRAIATTSSEYIVFLDGDCMVCQDFLTFHAEFAARGYFVAGNRALLSQSFSQQVLETQSPVYSWPLRRWLFGDGGRGLNRRLPLVHLPLGFLRNRNPRRWQGVKTCNLGVWRDDLLTVNGFDERYQGWGYEDSDLVLRLIRTGARCKDGRFALGVLHLWHPEHDRTGTRENLERLTKQVTGDSVRAQRGLDQYLAPQAR